MNTIGQTASAANWVGIDWGTTNIRAYLMDNAGSVLKEQSLARHVKDCSAEGWSNVLAKVVDGWPVSSQIPTIICGMVGSKFGWLEAPYVACPAGVDDLVAKSVHPTEAPNVTILPGLSCKDERGNHDVIRGEETQLLGLFERSEIGSGLICAPGTHTKWIWAENCTVSHFHTTMTGELFGLLTEHSILAQSIEASPSGDIGDKFDSGVAMAANGGGLLADIFKVRANGLFDELDGTDAGDFLSGLLVGADVFRTLSEVKDKLPPVPLIGPAALSKRYARALSYFDIQSNVLSAEEVTVAGLASIARQLGHVEASHVA